MAATTTGAIADGSMWRMTIRRSLAPSALAAWTKSISRRCRNSARTRRAASVQPVNAMARMMTRASPPPKNATIVTIRKKIGMDRTTSTTRISALSALPPMYPAMAPTLTPMIMIRITDENPTMSDVCRPFMRRTKMFRPRSSVPSGCVSVGAWLMLVRLVLPKRSPVAAGTTIARIVRMVRTTRPMTASLCWRKRWRTSCQNVRTGV